MINIKPYCDKYVIENQQEINQYHKNLLKDKKECHTLYFYSQKVNDTQIHQCTNNDKAYQCKSRKLVKHKF